MRGEWSPEVGRGESKHPSLPLARAERKPFDRKKKLNPRHQRENHLPSASLHKRIEQPLLRRVCIASLPVVFDTTRVLAGEIGEYIVTARKRQDCWYVGGLTGWTPRTLDVDLSLLDPGREYTATLLADDGRSAAEPARYALSTQRVTSATRLQIPVAPGGGFALKIEPADNK